MGEYLVSASVIIHLSRSILGLSLISYSLETHDGGLGRDGWHSGQGIAATGYLLIGSLTSPDATSNSLDAVLSAEWRDVSSVLTDFELLYDFSESGTVSGTVLSANSDLSSSLSHFSLFSKLECNWLIIICYQSIIYEPLQSLSTVSCTIVIHSCKTSDHSVLTSRTTNVQPSISSSSFS